MSTIGVQILVGSLALLATALVADYLVWYWAPRATLRRYRQRFGFFLIALTIAGALVGLLVVMLAIALPAPVTNYQLPTL